MKIGSITMGGIIFILSIALYNQTHSLKIEKERGDLLYCQTIYQSLEHTTTEATRNRVMLENTYFSKNCDKVLKGE